MHWIREKVALMACASVEDARVLARPGSDSIKRWPSARSATSIEVRNRSCPATLSEKASPMASSSSVAWARSAASSWSVAVIWFLRVGVALLGGDILT